LSAAAPAAGLRARFGGVEDASLPAGVDAGSLPLDAAFLGNRSRGFFGSGVPS
jgi:hypothetical protein